MKAAWPKLPGKKMQNDKKSAKIFMMPESDVVGDDAIMKSSSPMTYAQATQLSQFCSTIRSGVP